MRTDDRATAAERMLRLFDRRTEIEAVWLFPPRSRASAGAGAIGSTDLGILFTAGGAPPDPSAWLERLTQELDRVGVIGPRVVLLEQAEATLRHRAIERGQAIFFRDMTKVREFRARTWMEYVDRESPTAQRIASMRTGAGLAHDWAHERVEALRQHTERIGATLRGAGERFAVDRAVQDSILFNLLQACQASEDLFAELLARIPDGLDDPLEERDPLGALTRLGVLPSDLAGRLAAVMRLRNVVLYRYAELDLGVVLKHLPSAIEALEELAAGWDELVASSEPAPG